MQSSGDEYRHPQHEGHSYLPSSRYLRRDPQPEPTQPYQQQTRSKVAPPPNTTTPQVVPTPPPPPPQAANPIPSPPLDIPGTGAGSGWGSAHAAPQHTPPGPH